MDAKDILIVAVFTLITISFTWIALHWAPLFGLLSALLVIWLCCKGIGRYYLSDAAGCIVGLLTVGIVLLFIINMCCDRKIVVCDDGMTRLASPFYPLLPITYSSTASLHIERLDSNDICTGFSYDIADGKISQVRVDEIYKLSLSGEKFNVVEFGMTQGTVTLLSGVDSVMLVERMCRYGRINGFRYRVGDKWRTADFDGGDMDRYDYNPKVDTINTASYDTPI